MADEVQNESLSVEQAAVKFEGFLSDDGVTKTVNGAAPPEKKKPEQAAPDTQDSGDEPDVAAETPSDEQENGDAEQDTPAIELPQFWTAAQKDEFAKLSPEVQKIVLDRDREASKAVNDKLREAAEARKAAQAIQAQAEQEKQAVLQRLTALMPALEHTLNNKYANVDWVKLANEDPAGYIAKKAEYDRDVQIWQAAQAEKQAAERKAQETFEVQEKQYRQAEFQKLAEKMPEHFGTTEKATKAFDALGNYLLKQGEKYGIPADEMSNRIRQTRDAAVLEVAYKAYLYDKGKTALNNAVESAGNKPAPKVLKPTGTQDRTVKGDRLAALQDKARKTGRIEDAAAAYMEIMS